MAVEVAVEEGVGVDEVEVDEDVDVYAEEVDESAFLVADVTVVGSVGVSVASAGLSEFGASAELLLGSRLLYWCTPIAC